MPYRIRDRNEYPTWVGLVFVFNLIVGTGALTLPSVFAKAGWLLGLIVITILAFISYMTVTFVIETIACANAVMHWRHLRFLKRETDNSVPTQNGHSVTNSSIEHTPLFSQRNANRYYVLDGEHDTDDDTQSLLPREEVSEFGLEHTPLSSQSLAQYYVLDNKIELGEMAGLFFNDFGRVLFYLCIAIYLYGDLSIYSAAVAKSLRDVICQSYNMSLNGTSDDFDEFPCWQDHTLTRLDVYRLSLIAFAMLLGPFALFNVQKTKYIQMITVLLRWLAFTIMITLAVNRLIEYGPEGQPPTANILGLPSLFGACVYSFMCHHSLPSLIAPISDKRRIKSLMSLDYGLICTFYILLALTGAFAFAHIEDLYTLNFVPNPEQSSIVLKSVEYFLALFPVFTLSASFPIIAITLRNNLQTLFLDMSRIDSYNFVQRRLLFPILAISPPIIITFFTESLTSLVGFTGSYAGTGIQYLIPIALVYSARRTCADLLGQGIVNEYRSPFRSNWWLLFVLVWSCACVILVTVNFFTEVKTAA